jgi:hypothetical protein
MRFRVEDLRPHGWRPLQTLHIPDWCGCTTEYLPVPVGHGWLAHGADPRRGRGGTLAAPGSTENGASR